ncbi:CRISPR-associated protein Csm3 [Chloroflexus islandicus]|uniref:CRISPR-associated protein Csm3 n=1 Tax=Chloroflexus islandicus TaxID=1707952 RepID=A0A178MGY7_9CHLR|nr:CRISPR-associated RAMP protein Csx7 [Chloroflexus islandicus]OAN47264.1 CRISPR-associated protein Csm3 [Chloroflexus islandicus]
MPNIYSFEALRNRLSVRGVLTALTALRIGAGRESDVIGNDLPVLRDALGRPFIPGASLKGAFRARLEGLIRTVAEHEVRDFDSIEQQMREWARLASENKIDLDKEVWPKSTMIELTFGAPWLAGRILFKDALIDPDLWFGQFEVRNGVALNRDTETVEQGLLYDYEVVPAGMRFDFELVMENATDWQLGMVVLGLQPWIRGEMQVGGFRSRGLGYVRLDNVSYDFVELRRGDAESLLAFLDDTRTHTPDSATIDAWKRAFRDELQRRANAKPEVTNHA